ncbi:MAG: DUF362 domain-containing protein [Gracilibacteraceae bacterium]|jgi:uncharacterized protein (DUF362 family)|nr:DUF362 domain-containing protein [Gracilibacteraceae bacterium]
MNRVAIANCPDYGGANVNSTVSELMAQLGYDFADFIKPSMTVFIKPNWVASRWRESCPHRDTLWSVITHTAVVEAVADRVAAALAGNGKIIIGDNPSIDADFDELTRFTGIDRLPAKYDLPCELLDLRPLVCDDLENYGKKSKMAGRSGDPRGAVEINLGQESLFYNMDPSLFRGVFDEREETVAAHTGGRQLYTFSKSLYESDVYISVPKLKTHQKAGATLNLKGLVGGVTEKNQLVHWRVGSPERGGDEYPDEATLAAAGSAKTTHRGAHPGNDTIWRMVVDLYNAMRKRERKYFSVVDGIIAGDGQGPFCPRAKRANTLLAGGDLLAVDIVAARLMGIDPAKLRYLNWFLENGFARAKIEVPGYDDFFGSDSPYLDFSVPEAWREIKIRPGV